MVVVEVVVVLEVERRCAVSGRTSRRKGKRGERLACAALQDATGLEWRRGLSQTRGGGAESPDVECDELEWHVEVKYAARPNIRAALEQAERDAPPHRIPVALVRYVDPAHPSTADWILAIRLGSLRGLVKQLSRAWRYSR